jgi:tetratricopeptide (TPR) repeat protein
MASKESMVTAPVIVVLYDRIFFFDSWREAFRQRARLYAALAATWLVLAALLASTPRTSVGFESGTTPLVYLLNQCQLIVRYLMLAFWPRALVLDYGLPRPLTVADVWPQALVLAALGAVVLVSLLRWPKIGFLGAWVFITLAPTSSFVPISTEVGAERRMYLPLAGIVALVVVGSYWLLVERGRLDHAAEHRRRTAFTAGIAVACALLAAQTFIRNQEYESRLSIARTIVDRWPNGRGHFLYGTELLGQGQREQALAELRASAVDYPGAKYALGVEMLADGMVDAAIEQLQMFIRALPTHINVAPARDLLGRAYVLKSRFDLAEEEFTRLLREYPGYARRDDVRQVLDTLRQRN